MIWMNFRCERSFRWRRSADFNGIFVILQMFAFHLNCPNEFGNNVEMLNAFKWPDKFRLKQSSNLAVRLKAMYLIHGSCGINNEMGITVEFAVDKTSNIIVRYFNECFDFTINFDWFQQKFPLLVLRVVEENWSQSVVEDQRITNIKKLNILWIH